MTVHTNAFELAQSSKATDWATALLAKIDANFADHAAQQAAKTPAQIKRELAAGRIRNAKATIDGLRESVAFTAREWGWRRFDAYMAHRKHTLAALALAASYRRSAAEAFAEARKLEAVQ